MPILEPMTVLTDYLLAVLGVVFGLRLWRGDDAGLSSRRLWATSLLAMAVAALAGGTAHGFADRLGDAGYWLVWRITVWGIGVASLAVSVAMARFAFSPSIARLLTVLFALQFSFYAVWMLRHDGFEYVIADYLPAMLFALGIAAWRWRSDGWPGGPWLVSGILVSFAAAGVQASGFALHRHFNHNDLYHVIQMFGLYLLYRGGLLLPRGTG